jgi:hypothetical protein
VNSLTKKPETKTVTLTGLPSKNTRREAAAAISFVAIGVAPFFLSCG